MQLKKHYHKLSRYLTPCGVCGKDHPTGLHNKTSEEIDTITRSRTNNPQDKKKGLYENATDD